MTLSEAIEIVDPDSGAQANDAEPQDAIGRFLKACRIVCAAARHKENHIADAGKMVAPENKPLTLEQLRQMDEEPVWVGEKDKRSRIGHYGLVDTVRERVIFNRSTYTTFKAVAGKTAYARRPEDVPKSYRCDADGEVRSEGEGFGEPGCDDEDGTGIHCKNCPYAHPEYATSEGSKTP